MPSTDGVHFYLLQSLHRSKKVDYLFPFLTLVVMSITEEVEGISLDDLHVKKEVIRQLEIDMICAFERDVLSYETVPSLQAASCSYGTPGTGQDDHRAGAGAPAAQ